MNPPLTHAEAEDICASLTCHKHDRCCSEEEHRQVDRLIDRVRQQVQSQYEPEHEPPEPEPPVDYAGA